MTLLQYRIAIQSLRTNRVRTILTTLGIIIGVASITLILSLGSGIENAVREQIGKLNNNVILVTSGADISPTETIRNYNPYSINPTTSLTEQDFNSMKINPNISGAAPIMLLSGTASTTVGSRSVPIVATSPDLANILNLSVKPGEFFENTTIRNVAVIGSKLANDLFGGDQILGQQFTLKGRTHTVVGVLKSTDSVNLSGIDLDRAAIISFDDGKSFNLGVAQIQQLLATTKDPSKIDQSKKEIDEALLANHKNEHDFRVLAGDHVAENGSPAYRAIVMITAIVATVTLIVGGIGIMNIMLVGVSERTREIGIRKALGATNAHILGQFLIEALIVCVVGGFIGLAVGYGLAFAIAMQLAFQPAVTWQIASTGLGMAFVTGIIFGLYPAIKAARKDPIESLRQYH